MGQAMSAKALPALAMLLAGCAATAEPAQRKTDPLDDRFPAISSFSESCEDWDEWDKPAKPYRIYGSTFYLGTCGISAIFIANPEGHFLIDTGTEAGARQVAANIKRLGFDLEDIAVITHSHEHFDHVGGLATLQKLSGGQVVASTAAANVLRTGMSDPGDPQHGMHEPMAPVTVGRTIAGGESIENEMGRITAISTPGHTPGALSWQWEDCEKGGGCKTIVYADSLSPVSSDDYRFSDHPEYLAAYRESIAKIAALKCDILLTPHPSASDMISRAANGSFEGGMNCKDYAAAVTKRLDDRLAKEASAK